ncbi:MAG TPA: hypothetical protein VMW75_10050 [Thermoanaerobaculia bacterium]|nr:hypothetical protein [Thermoanaerobaculia bacterium]
MTRRARIASRFLYVTAALEVACVAVYAVAIVIHTNEYSHARLLDGGEVFLLCVVCGWMLSGIVLFLLDFIQDKTWRLHFSTRYQAFSEGFVTLMLWGVLTVGVLLGLTLYLMHSSVGHLRILRLRAVDVTPLAGTGDSGNLPLAEHGAADREGDQSYLQGLDNVIALDFRGDPHRVFSQPIVGLSDMLTLPGQVLVVAGSRLLRSTPRAGFAVVAELPAPGFRFGQHSTDRGLMPGVILFGAIGGKGVAYRLTPAGQYSKVVETPEPIRAASACFDSTAIFVGDKLVLLTPGHRPRVLFEVGPGFGAVGSILARSAPKTAEGDCFFLLATADQVFLLQHGVASLLIAGLGGELRADSASPADAILMDGKRHVAVELHFPQSR